MCKIWLGVVAAVSITGCGQTQSPTAPKDVGHPPPPTGPSLPPPDASLPPDASPPLDASPPVTLTPSKSWPFHAWDRAEAYTFNLRRPGPGAKLRVYNEQQGWTESPTKGPTLTKSQAKQALRLIAKTQGQMIVSKCPFPRHGIVFFQGETPVGSVSVCFECGDIMLWPAYSQDPGWEERKSGRFGKLMKAYDRVYPQWKRLFERDLSLATDWTKLPKPNL